MVVVNYRILQLLAFLLLLRFLLWFGRLLALLRVAGSLAACLPFDAAVCPGFFLLLVLDGFSVVR